MRVARVARVASVVSVVSVVGICADHCRHDEGGREREGERER
jgi:hypothetical protein